MRHPIRTLRAIAMTAGLVAPTALLAGAELRLVDGQRLEGVSVERRDGLYLLALETGDTLPVPAALVRELKLTGDDTPPVGGLVESEPGTLVGPEPQRSNPPLEQRYRVLEPGRSRWSRGVVDPLWQPRPSLGLGGDVSQFSPSRWPRSIIDPVWRPRSVFDSGNDVTRFRPSSWAGGSYDWSWRPTDGFAGGDREDR